MGSTRKGLWLVIAYPDGLGRGESGERGIAGQVDQPLRADGLGDPVALGGAALVGPDDAGAQRVVLLIQQDQAVHLPREAQRLHVLWRDAQGFGAAQAGLDGGAGCAPPIFGVLLGPTWS